MLVVIKTLHTIVWVFFVACILALPVAGAAHRFGLAGWLTALVGAECVVIALNRGKCPLTNVAARYTANRADNFDIYLPNWLARYNKQIFGTLFLAGELFVFWSWLRSTL